MLIRILRILPWLGLGAAALAFATWHFLIDAQPRGAPPAGATRTATNPPPAPGPAGPAVLVLYDAPMGRPEQKLGLSYAIMLGNLLGHFDARVTLMPVADYAAGRIAQSDATFYLGTQHDADLPAAFVHDALRSQQPLVWLKYSLWKLGNRETSLARARGLSFERIRGYDSPPSRANPAPGFLDTVEYKGLPFRKYYRFDPRREAADGDPDIGLVKVEDEARAQVLVRIANSRTGEKAPYVVRSGSFWYVADLPFSFIGPRDRYLVFADLLHDMLGIAHAEDHPAMIRLEDIHAMVNPESITRIVDLLHARAIPFSLAVIPHYRDPLGAYNGGKPQDIPLSRANSLRRALDHAVELGGDIVAHGYTHQYEALKNPGSGVSAEDYEFWDAVHNRPVPGDSTAWALGRLRASLDELKANGYTPVAWTTPHYQGSPRSFRAVPRVFATTYQRVAYYTSESPQLAPVGAHDYVSWQFFPYPIARDYYGQRVLPENLGNVQYMVDGHLTGRTLGYDAQDLVTNARYALAVRDGFASFFFHPFLLDVPDVDGWEQLVRTLDGITALGYRWTSPSQLVATSCPSASRTGLGCTP